MDTILTQVIKVLKSEELIVSREEKLAQFFEHLVCELMRLALERLDKTLVLPYLEAGYISEGKKERSVTFSFGTVSYKRRRLSKPGKVDVYPLDALLSLQKKQRFSVLTETRLAHCATLGVYRKVSELVGLLAPYSVSHQKLQALTVKKGLEIEHNQSLDLAEKSDEEKQKVPILYVEGDAFCVKQQGGGTLYIHRFQVCEGREKVGKKRNKLSAYKEFIDLDRKKALGQLKAYIAKHYEISSLMIVSNSDGGSGYEGKQFSGLGSFQEHFIDRYHVHRKIKERLRFVPPALQKLLQARLYAYDKDALEVVYDTAESWAETVEDIENLGKLKAYIERNWAYLKPFEKRERLRGYEAVIGTCESNHRSYTYRMKKQGKYWSKRGATAMIKLLAAGRNGELAKYSSFQPLERAEEETWEDNERVKGLVRQLLSYHPEEVDYSDFIRGHIPNPQLNTRLNRAFSCF